MSSRCRLSAARFLASIITLLVLTSCEREERRFQHVTSAAERRPRERLVNLVPGPYTADVYVRNPYERNAHGIAEGKRLFTWYNCVGCHGNGGGGMGPPLMDDKWIYGGDSEQIFATIVEGRPNGMPAFRGKIPDHQVWQLAAYVQSLSGRVPKDAASGRPDNMFVKKPEQMTPDLIPEREAARHP
jgi:cytochrome c oxidase cbb3-type subunit III